MRIEKILSLLAVLVSLGIAPITGRAGGASADEPSLEAQLRFFRVNGKASFGAKWFPEKGKGSINLGLVWASYDQEVSSGFSLTHASEKLILAPALPPGCEVESLRGSLSWQKNGISSIGIILVGPACADYFPRLTETPLELVFKNVPQLIREGSRRELRVKVLERPL